jgi:hypothetical protein
MSRSACRRLDDAGAVRGLSPTRRGRPVPPRTAGTSGGRPTSPCAFAEPVRGSDAGRRSLDQGETGARGEDPDVGR